MSSTKENLPFAGNEAGRAIAMTLFSPLRPWYRRAPQRPFYERGPWLRLVFLAMRALPSQSSTIRKLSFIHFARWVIVKRIPNFGQPRESLAHKLLMFESNYNGSFDPYIDGFAYVLGEGMSKIWGTSYGFPGPRPVTPFKRYIKANEFTADHYYSAYPTATATMITSALTVKNDIVDFNQRTTGCSHDDFRHAYRELLTKIQGQL